MTGKEKVIQDFPICENMSIDEIIKYIDDCRFITCHYCNYRLTSNCWHKDTTCTDGIREYLESEIK